MTNQRADAGGDDPRDAHLLAALRHAPDRDALPPREVSARILAAARAAVQPARVAPWWQRVGAWLVQPQVAASFGTLAVASIVGLMWSTREPPTVEPPLQQSAAEQAAATSAVASAMTAPAAAPSELRRDERDLLAQTQTATPAPKPEAAPRRAKEAKAPAAKAEAPPPAPFREPVADSVAAAPAAAPPAARLEEARGADATVSADTAVTAKASQPRGAAASMPALESSRQTLAAAGNAAATIDPLVRIDALLAAGDAAWSNAGRMLPHGPAQAAWWSQVRRATGGAWQPAPSTRADAAPSSSLTLLVARQGIASIDIAADSVQWCPADRSACWRAPITPAQAEAWIAEVARW
jgi:hypothetical protein